MMQGGGGGQVEGRGRGDRRGSGALCWNQVTFSPSVFLLFVCLCCNSSISSLNCLFKFSSIASTGGFL